MKAKVLAKLLLKHPEAEVFIENDNDHDEFFTGIEGGCFIKKLTDGGSEEFPGVILKVGSEEVVRVNSLPRGIG
jgi:hypothetical protein